MAESQSLEALKGCRDVVPRGMAHRKVGLDDLKGLFQPKQLYEPLGHTRLWLSGFGVRWESVGTNALQRTLPGKYLAEDTLRTAAQRRFQPRRRSREAIYSSATRGRRRPQVPSSPAAEPNLAAPCRGSGRGWGVWPPKPLLQDGGVREGASHTPELLPPLSTNLVGRCLCDLPVGRGG